MDRLYIDREVSMLTVALYLSVTFNLQLHCHIWCTQNTSKSHFSPRTTHKIS